MENKSNKNLIISLVVILMVVGCFAFWLIYNSSSVSAPVADTNTPPVVNPSEDTSPGSINAGATKSTISYANALIKYKDARLQINTACQASPNKMTFKNGSYLMIDNRAPAFHMIKIGTLFPIKAYGFKIIKLSSAKLPATWYVDCDKSQNVATILIQK